ncbi:MULTISPECIES: temperature-sensitive replication protein [Lactobacillus]|uniref:Temperature-sensitive replication protein n=1 Tax=Lactobacillus xujianguonis TaxID=2495899 RepID=A0A437SUS7_9LACO|nr:MULTISPECIES: temperature-sensitive replication protein [Lactobacillus]RVU70664.1 temperature-sensitive replication protein [Lactobacillus xujianguonis]RVU73264.1 temperature-sensitive replication protein [Lactobacillus xujianguonis]
MKSNSEIRWRDQDLEEYETDKLYFIWNILKQPFPPQYRQMVGELQWRKETKQKQTNLARIEAIIAKRPDRGAVREEWKQLHPNQAEVKKDGKTIIELAKLFPKMADQLGAFIELKRIVIKYFGKNGEPYYDLQDFTDIAPENYVKNGFRTQGITRKQFLRLYPQVDPSELNDVLKQIELEEEDGLELIPYYQAVALKALFTREN